MAVGEAPPTGAGVAVGEARGVGEAPPTGAGVAVGEGVVVGDAGASPACSSLGSFRATEPSVTALLMWMTCPHLRHFIRTERPATFSSAIWYFALQLGQRNFIQLGARASVVFRTGRG